MFHANAWGLAHQAGLVGADLIMPGRFLQAEPLAGLIEQEKVTIAGGVPTVFMDVLRHADENDVDFSTLRKVTCGGSAVPLSLMQAFEERHGVYIEQAWGMTEMSPLGTIARPPAGTDDEDRKWDYRASAGRVNPLVEARIVDDDGAEVDWDGEATGELEVRGPWIAASYYRDDSDDKFDDGWLRTGDIASIDPRGYVRITDRAKDVIKSGGEWISSVELENEIMGHPDVAEAAVIAIPDERWSERPLACIVPEEGKDVSAASVREHLADRVAKWWLPDTYAVIDEVPKTSVGKFDKKVLRQRLEDGELETERAWRRRPHELPQVRGRRLRRHGRGARMGRARALQHRRRRVRQARPRPARHGLGGLQRRPARGQLRRAAGPVEQVRQRAGGPRHRARRPGGHAAALAARDRRGVPGHVQARPRSCCRCPCSTATTASSTGCATPRRACS